MAGHNDRDPPTQPEFRERAIDRSEAFTEPGNADVVGRGETAGINPPVEEGMTAAGDADQRQPGEPLGAALRGQVPEDPQFDVHPALPQRGAALDRFRQEHHVHVRSLRMDPVGQSPGQPHQEEVGGLHSEGALEMNGIETGPGPQDVVAAAQQRAYLLPEFQGSRGRNHPLPRADQQRVTDGTAEPGQGTAGCRG